MSKEVPKVYYQYRNIILGCECCSESANILEIRFTDRLVESDQANTFYEKVDLDKYLSEVWDIEEYWLDPESDFC
jgi:hypothetical protein